MKRDSISIIIPVYNVEKFIIETLKSVKNQITSPDEVIIINDGSTDNSLNIIKNFSSNKEWRIFNTLNQGLGLTRNYGKYLARSEYIFFLDSDDLILNNFIYEMKKIIKKYKSPEMILFSGETFTDTINRPKSINLEFSIEGQYFAGDKLLTKLSKKKETLPQASRYLTKKKLWISNKLNYPKGIAEDEGVFFPLISLSKNTYITKNKYYKYRADRPGSITSSSIKSIHAEDYINRIIFTLNFMKKNNSLIVHDELAWKYNLERKCLKYINICIKIKKKFHGN